MNDRDKIKKLEPVKRPAQHSQRQSYRRKKDSNRLRLVVTLVALVLIAAGTSIYFFSKSSPSATNPAKTTTTKASVVTTEPQPVWRVSWTTPMAWGHGTAANSTIRDLATVEAAGTSIKIRISNEFGTGPLDIGAATVGIESIGPAISPGTLQNLTFSGSAAVSIPIAQSIVSDPVQLSTTTGETIAISLYVANVDLMTVHYCCSGHTLAYYTRNNIGDTVNDLTGSTFNGGATNYGILVDAIDSLETTGRGSIVVLGDSISDGYHSALRWPDVLQARINALPDQDHRAVVDESITANTLTTFTPNFSKGGGGPPGLTRLDDDVLSLPGVSYLIVFLGTNDIFFGAPPSLIESGYQQVVSQAHQQGIKVIGATLLPRLGSDYLLNGTYYRLWDSAHESELEQLNQWILTSRSFDAVLNFNIVVANIYNGACQPDAMYPQYDSTDHLHPNASGQVALGNSIDTQIFDIQPAPLASPLISVTRTPGCQGEPGLLPASTTTQPAPVTTAAAPVIPTTNVPPIEK